jgi:hypothetical protein
MKLSVRPGNFEPAASVHIPAANKNQSILVKAITKLIKSDKKTDNV